MRKMILTTSAMLIGLSAAAGGTTLPRYVPAAPDVKQSAGSRDFLDAYDFSVPTAAVEPRVHQYYGGPKYRGGPKSND